MHKTIPIIVVFALICAATQVVGAPIIVTGQGLNHSESLSIASLIPQQYFELVDWVEFVAEPTDFRGQRTLGTAYASWGAYHDCYDAKITVVNTNRASAYYVLWHELGHIYEWCHLKQDNSSELFADNFVNLKPLQ